MCNVIGVIAGVQKCGTTALLDMLVQHPRLSTHITGQWPRFLHDQDFEEQWSRIRETHFKSALPNQAYVARDISLSSSEDALSRFNKIFPHAKCVMLVRDPVARAYSAYSFAKAKGRETRASFEEILATECVPTNTSEDDRLHFEYLSLGCYAKTLGQMDRILGRSRILVLNTLDLKTNPIATCNKVFEHLGLEQFDVQPLVKNAAYTPRFMRLQQWSRQNTRLRQILRQCLPIALKRRILRSFDLVNATSRVPPKLGDRERRVLERYYASDLVQLKEEWGLDLGNPSGE